MNEEGKSKRTKAWSINRNTFNTAVIIKPGDILGLVGILFRIKIAYNTKMMLRKR